VVDYDRDPLGHGRNGLSVTGVRRRFLARRSHTPLAAQTHSGLQFQGGRFRGLRRHGGVAWVVAISAKTIAGRMRIGPLISGIQSVLVTMRYLTRALYDS
jgi:hypothetical protein